MEQLSLFQSASLTVTQITVFIRQLLEMNETLQDVWVQGEISNFSRPSSGHLYFTLKDKNAALRAVMWKGAALRLNLPLRDGLLVEAHGRIGVYDAGGQYQLYVDVLRPAGEGALYAEFMRLKVRLEAEGLFNSSRKRDIPDNPRRIGIITSPTGAALRDMLHTLGRRLPLAEVILAPAAVQGDAAPAEIVAALEHLNSLEPAPDVILLARGGGSIEDLWSFNDEHVVRAVAASSVPVISGVGHETDFTLTDFAADLRAPTPTAAAELATPITLSDLSLATRGLSDRLQVALSAQFESRRAGLDDLRQRLRYFSPSRRIEADRQRVDDLSRRAAAALAHRLELQRAHLHGLSQKLQSLNPLDVLRRGYAIVTRADDGRLVHSGAQVMGGDALRVRLSDAVIAVQVQTILKEDA